MKQPSRKRNQAFVNRIPFAIDKGEKPVEAAGNPWIEQTRIVTEALLQKVESTVRARPLTCLGIAAGMGILAAFWSKRR